MITASDLSSCPAPVIRYLKLAGVLGLDRKLKAHIVHGGDFRMKPKQRWFPIRGDYHFAPEVPSFEWKASISLFPLVFISVIDRYLNGVGKSLVKLESIFTIGESVGPEVNESSLGRLLTEFVLMPTALVPSAQLRWEPIGAESSRALLTSCGLQVSAAFSFGQDGLPEKVTIERFGVFDGEFIKRPFIVRTSQFKKFDGLLLPTDIAGSWDMGSEEFSWLHFKITSAEFN